MSKLFSGSVCDKKHTGTLRSARSTSLAHQTPRTLTFWGCHILTPWQALGCPWAGLKLGSWHLGILSEFPGWSHHLKLVRGGARGGGGGARQPAQCSPSLWLSCYTGQPGSPATWQVQLKNNLTGPPCWRFRSYCCGPCPHHPGWPPSKGVCWPCIPGCLAEIGGEVQGGPHAWCTVVCGGRPLPHPQRV